MNSAGTLFEQAPRRRSCPHCLSPRIHRWGRFSGRQRYRCLACTRTFSTFTGTALHYLKRTDAWTGFVMAVRDSLTVRQAALVTGIHRDTAFRWRHRFLHAVQNGDRVVLRREAAVGSTWFRFSRKGQKRPTGSTAAGPDAQHGMRTPDRVWVVLAKDPGGLSISAVVGATHPAAGIFSGALRNRIAPNTRIRSHRGPYSAEAACARRLRLPFDRFTHPPFDGDPEPIREYVVRIKRWMRRFNGVATRYLSHYLSWFQVMDSGWSSRGWDLCLVAMTCPDQDRG